MHIGSGWRWAGRCRALAVAAVASVVGSLLVLAPSSVAGAASCPSFTKSGTAGWGGLTFNGDAQLGDGSPGVASDVLRLTHAATRLKGSAWTTDPVALGSDTSFSAFFETKFSNVGSGGADGVVFALQSNGNNALGDEGGMMGFGSFSGAPLVPHSLGVELDDYYNSDIDGGLTASHVGIDENGSVVSLAAADLDFDLDNGATINVWVDYAGSTDRLEVRVSNGNTRPRAPTVAETVDLPRVLGTTNPFVGFTSGTGGSYADHDVLDWDFRSCFDPVGADVNDQAVQVIQAVPSGPNIVQATRLAGRPNTVHSLTYYGADACVDGHPVGATKVGGTVTATTDGSGNAYVTSSLPNTGVNYLVVDAVDTDIGTSVGISSCTRVGPDNDSWTRALKIPLAGSGTTFTGSETGYLDASGQSRWYKFDIQPGSRVRVDLTDLPADYDLALFRDIGQAFNQLNSVKDLTHLSAEFAPSVFSPSVFSPSVFSPSVFSPDAYSPSVFSPSVFSPSVFSPSVFSPSVFSPSVFSPSVFSPSVFSPSVFSPSVFSPSVFSPLVFSPSGLPPSVFSPETFASAQTRSLAGVSATTGTAAESIVANTWLATGEFYVRVTGRNGAFDSGSPFTLKVSRDDEPACAGVTDTALQSPPAPSANAQTIILTNPGRMPGSEAGNSATDKAAMRMKLDTLAARPDVQGVVVDLSGDPRLGALTTQADAHKGCPFATNLVASAIKDVIGGYRATNPLKYVVLVGNDAAIPFFRYPDQALLGPESDYSPPVNSASASDASLRLNYTLGQDEYGASTVLSLGDGAVPMPDLAVGRLVETATEISGMVDAYIGLTGGVVPTPTKSLVTGYDFLSDSATSVATDLLAGSNAPVDKLIAPPNISPTDPSAWTADDLRSQLLNSRHDLIYLAGHFSANSALAADFSTSVLSTELDSSAVNLTNAIVFSAGCHSGYNIVDGDAIPGVTATDDWVQAFTHKQATLIAGTGYQYGDTDFLEYSERIYAGFAHQLRVGTGPVAVGDALMQSKRLYMRQTPDIRGLHRKALIESTLFGLPMLRVDLPAGRIPASDDTSIVTATTGFASDPGATLGLKYADASIASPLEPHGVTMKTLDSASTPVTATYFSGPDGVVTNPAEPALPLINENVSVAGNVLRGVGFRGGAYTDQQVVPLTGAATTDLRGVHAPFASTVFFPMRLTTVNLFDAVAGGDTRLLVTPVQHRVDAVGDTNATARVYDNVDVRLFYSGNLDAPALSDAPSVSGVEGSVKGNDVVLRAHAIGNPAAGIQQLWATYTGDGPSRWASIDLVQCVKVAGQLPVGCSVEDSSNWVGRLVGAAPAANSLRFMVQAVNGVGLVTLDDNLGGYYPVTVEPATPPPPPITAALSLVAPASGVFGSTVPVTVTLTGPGANVSGRAVEVAVGTTTRTAVTNDTGVASVNLPLTVVPGTYDVRASFAGADNLTPAAASTPITVTKAPTDLTVTSGPAVATLHDAAGAPLQQRTVFFVLTGPAPTKVVARTTDLLGRAALGTVPLPVGTWNVTAMFLGTVPFPNGTVTLSDPTYVASSAEGTPIVVTTAPTMLTLTSSDNPSSLGAPVTLTATVSAPAGTTPTGTVQFAVDGTPMVPPVALSGGTATSAPIPALVPGSHSLTAAYSGDTASAPSSASITQVVQYVVRISKPVVGSVNKAGSTIPVTFTLGDVNGQLISDAEATGLVTATACRVKVSAEGTQTLAPTCAKYDATTHTFSVNWNTAKKPTGSARVLVSISYPDVPALQKVIVPTTLR